MHPQTNYYIGVDVGTGSARACIIDDAGEIVGLASENIRLWQSKHGHYEQSTADVWRCICSAVRRAIRENNIPSSMVRGLAFDATCSLAVFATDDDSPMSVTASTFDTDRNVILWLDHRAVIETERINTTQHKVLEYVGGRMSVEMEIPKILWLKNNMPAETFARCKFYDLVDALTHLATGGETRSLCSLVCKQGYLPAGVEGSASGWPKDFLVQIGLGSLVEGNFQGIGGINDVNGRHLHAGELAGRLSEKAALDLGLPSSIAIGSGVIDAYAGWIGTVGAKADFAVTTPRGCSTDDMRETLFTRLSAVAGTSTCHLVMSPSPIFVPGVWGPYRDTILPGCWMAEGGQSATGQLLQHVLETHPATQEAKSLAMFHQMDIFTFLNKRLEKMADEQEAQCIPHLSRHLFFYGDLFGNRSPVADSNMTGSIVGLTSDVSVDSLAILYYGTLEFIALQTRQIMDVMNKSGHNITSIFMSGSQCQNSILVHLIASACDIPVVIPRYVNAAVCHGAAMLAAKAASIDIEGMTTDLLEIMDRMSKPGKTFHPTKNFYEKSLLAAKYRVHLDQCHRQLKYRKMVDELVASQDCLKISSK
ncbi:uncharacterized protein N7498_002074 [Penicillium cinerascens]|uniref:Carbohydrate kinase FGGY C-terminal domain-containing protein n=1 Tax=Penicillium cinerascens TaxID=70096 RepID=A0A9W9N9D6_9EURO|nr:uncharacterized protein N7498_002074 [Penicillium cinerascens]KAJ5215667.1 hypothetical protein N7498_002074 [Penicillium cinerascens]